LSELLNWVIAARQGPTVEVGFSAATLVPAIDGMTATFTLQPAPMNGVMVFNNGTLLTQGVQPAGQYTTSGAQITFQPQAIPQIDMAIQAFVW
jgi:hypothetical protein